LSARRFDRIADLTSPGTLSAVVGEVQSIDRMPLATVGFSGATHERLTVTTTDGTIHRFVFKDVRLDHDWICGRTADRVGREAALLDDPGLAGVWDVFESPYVAYAMEPGEIGLLMNDVSAHLFPDVRAPIAERAEDALLDALAALHARFWESSALAASWLVSPETYLDFVGPTSARQFPYVEVPATLSDTITRGWARALTTLPPQVAGALEAPAAELYAEWADLPRTLIHGDTKVANFAVLPEGRVVAFDWAMLGAGPPSMDLGWYVAVNATRLAGSKERVLEHYRTRLEYHLGRSVTDAVWQRLTRSTVVFGARLLLWAKGAALETGTPHATAEWEWWESRLTEWVGL
jgi:hypothetical protein